MRTTLWRYHLGGGCALALAYVYLPFPPLRIAALVALRLATIAATLASVRLWSPARRLPFHLFAAGEAVGFVAGSLGSSAAVTRAGGSVAAAALTCVAYLIGIAGYALLIRTRSPGRDHAGLIDATVISTGVGMLAWVFLASPYSVDDSLPLVERGLSVLSMVLDVLVIALVIRLAIGGRDRTRAYLLLTAGWLVLVAADIGRALLVRLGTYDPASPVEAGWLVAYALWGAAVLHPSAATLTDPVPVPQVGLTRGRLASLAGASLMAPAILAIQGLRGQRIDVPVIVAACALLFLVVLARMAVLVRLNESTVRELRGTYEVFQSSMLRGGGDRARGAGGPLPADRRPAHRPGRRGRGAGPLAPPGPRAGPPAEFIPLAEETGLVVELDRFVLRQACRQVAGWVADAGPLLLHVNLSAHHLLRNDLAGNVAAALRDSGLPPECLALELTESVLMHDLEVAIVRLHELKRLGVGQAIDDFGTGYSSLAYLRQMPIDAVKIDKSFVDGVAEESAVARAIIALATTLHLDTVAEGVERPEQATALAELGCHLAQGYHFSRPIPAADMARLTGQHPVATTLSHPASATRPQPPGLSTPRRPRP